VERHRHPHSVEAKFQGVLLVGVAHLHRAAHQRIEILGLEFPRLARVECLPRETKEPIFHMLDPSRYAGESQRRLTWLGSGGD